MIKIVFVLFFIFMGPFMPLFRQDSREQTGKHWMKRAEQDQQRTSRWKLNSGHREHRCAVCRLTNHEVIGANQNSVIFIFNYLYLIF